MCAQKAVSTDAVESVIETCPEDCQEISYPSVVFGESLVINLYCKNDVQFPSEIATYLPSDWDDNKEKKITQFQVGVLSLFSIKYLENT